MSVPHPSAATSPAASVELERELAQLLVSSLNLELRPEDIAADAALFGDDGLGLDSIDVLELALSLSKRYGVELRSDDENNDHIFASLRSLAGYVGTHRTR